MNNSRPLIFVSNDDGYNAEGIKTLIKVAMDYGDVLVHIFLPDVRDYYDLEHLWDDATLTHIPDLD